MFSHADSETFRLLWRKCHFSAREIIHMTFDKCILGVVANEVQANGRGGTQLSSNLEIK